MKNENITTIQNTAPNAWADFNKFCNEKYTSFFTTNHPLKIESIPFSMLLGVFQEYFIANAGAELDLGNLSFEQLENDVVEAFIAQETIMKHYS
jgi:hypothetical protein